MPLATLRTGITLYYEIHGNGPEPLALIMGTSADHGYWGYQTPAYAERYRTIIYDARGTGQSSRSTSPSDCTMRVMADDLKALLDHLEIERAHISGLSLGSTVAQELAIAYPQTVATLQLHGTWAGPDPAFVYTIEGMKYPLLLEDRIGFSRTALSWIVTSEFLNDQARGGQMLKAMLANPNPPSTEGILGHIHADITHDATSRLGEIRCPTLITAGELDIQVPPRLGRVVHELIPGSEFHLFTGAGSSHLACVERADEFNRLTLGWLARHPI